MDGHIQEHAAGNFHVFRRRGCRVAAGDAQNVQVADLALFDQFAHLLEIGVKAAVETDLAFHPGFVHRVDGFIDLRQAVIDRFFAEDVLACVGGRDHQVGVRVGGGTDRHCVDGFVIHDLLVIRIDIIHMQLVRQFLAAARFTSAMATTTAPGTRVARFPAWILPMRPAPMTPTRSTFCALIIFS